MDQRSQRDRQTLLSLSQSLSAAQLGATRAAHVSLSVSLCDTSFSLYVFFISPLDPPRLSFFDYLSLSLLYSALLPKRHFERPFLSPFVQPRILYVSLSTSQSFDCSLFPWNRFPGKEGESHDIASLCLSFSLSRALILFSRRSATHVEPRCGSSSSISRSSKQAGWPVRQEQRESRERRHHQSASLSPSTEFQTEGGTGKSNLIASTERERKKEKERDKRTSEQSVGERERRAVGQQITLPASRQTVRCCCCFWRRILLSHED